MTEITNQEQPAASSNRGTFVPSPEFSPPYPPLPHRFNDNHELQILCRAKKGSVKQAIALPLEPGVSEDIFVLQMGYTPDCEGFKVHEIQINAPIKWQDKTGSTTLIEYIDSDMGLIAGREIWGWPKKMAEIIWTQIDAGWTVTCNKQKDQDSLPLMKVEYTISEFLPPVEWPVMFPVYLVKRVPNASLSVPPLTQLVRIGGEFTPGTPLPTTPGTVRTETKGTATVQFFNGPHDQLASFFGPVEVLAAKMSITKGSMAGGLGLGEVVHQWEE